MAGRGESTRAEADTARSSAFLLRKLALRGQEALQGFSDDIQPIAFMTEGAAVSRAIAKIVVDTDTYHEEGTGFLVSPGVLLTNQHVIRDADAARSATVVFDYESDESGRYRPETSFRFAPDRLAIYSPEEGGLDYALVALGERIQGAASLEELGCCALSNSDDRHFVGMNVNIIQHPGGRRKQIAIRNNLLTHRTPNTLLYETDTEMGSSGSPVFNDDWDVVALHHYGEPFTEKVDANDNPLPLNVNEGIRISRIYNDLATNHLPHLSEERRRLLEAVLAGAAVRTESPQTRQLEKRPPQTPEEHAVTYRENDMELEESGSALRLSVPMKSVPFEVNVRVIGMPGSAGKAVTAIESTKHLPQLTRGSEGKRLDRDYTNRNGFDGLFIEEVPVSLRKILKPVAERIAPLADGTEFGELHYQNFSVLMDSQRDLALLTATNIDFDSYMSVDRKSGQVAGPEGETWYKDRRISDEYYVGQDFYSEWSHKFDRGHLTRRNDPTWGTTEEEAERANADTFHFTNCSPQHFRFNQSAQFWQGIERYVLEQGGLKPGRAKRMTVLQGPVLNDRDDLWADSVQVPSHFWKIVIWNGAHGPRAVGMLANQSDLFDEDRTYLPRPNEDQPVEVRQFHVPISRIAKLTKLDLDDFQAIDTFPQGMPGAGEAVARITKWADITL